jgi:DNA gyrase/topoisomerase IV subunit A
MESNAALETLTAEIAALGRRIRRIRVGQANRDEQFATIMLEFNAVKERQGQERRTAIDDDWERERAANLRFLRRPLSWPPAEPPKPIPVESRPGDDDGPGADW